MTSLPADDPHCPPQHIPRPAGVLAGWLQDDSQSPFDLPAAELPNTNMAQAEIATATNIDTNHA